MPDPHPFPIQRLEVEIDVPMDEGGLQRFSGSQLQHLKFRHSEGFESLQDPWRVVQTLEGNSLRALEILEIFITPRTVTSIQSVNSLSPMKSLRSLEILCLESDPLTHHYGTPFLFPSCTQLPLLIGLSLQDTSILPFEHDGPQPAKIEQHLTEQARLLSAAGHLAPQLIHLSLTCWLCPPEESPFYAKLTSLWSLEINWSSARQALFVFDWETRLVNLCALLQEVPSGSLRHLELRDDETDESERLVWLEFLIGALEHLPALSHLGVLSLDHRKSEILEVDEGAGMRLADVCTRRQIKVIERGEEWKLRGDDGVWTGMSLDEDESSDGEEDLEM